MIAFTLTALLAVEPPKPVVALLPLVSTAELQEPAYATSLRLQEALERTSAMVMHQKQIYVVADAARIGDQDFDKAASAKRVGDRLGATHVLFGKLTRNGANLVLELNAIIDGNTPTTQSLSVASTDLQSLLDKGPSLLVASLGAAITEAAVKTLPSQPAKAFIDYAACHHALTKQAVSLRSPVILDVESRVTAVKRCTAATTAAPQMKQAFAALGFARALVSEREQAEAALASGKSDDALVPYYTIGKFWILSRFYDPQTAITFLRETTTKYPGFLLGRGYLGEALNATKTHDDALEVFTAYSVDVPRQPWVRSQIGYTQAKRGDHAKAIEATKAALDLAVDDDDLKLELASRFIDAGKVEEAQKMLESMARDPNAKGELLLRLGYTHLLLGHLDDADKWFKTTFERAKGPRDWRTRGRARYDLARVAAKKGNTKGAIDELERAFQEGYRDAAKLAGEKDFDALRADPRFQALGQKPRPQQLKLPTFSSPFAHDPLSGGELTQAPTQPKNDKPAGIRF